MLNIDRDSRFKCFKRNVCIHMKNLFLVNRIEMRINQTIDQLTIFLTWWEEATKTNDKMFLSYS